FHMRVIRLHVFTLAAILDIGVQHDDHVGPAWAAIACPQYASISHGVDRLAQIAVFSADAVQIVAQVMILRESLGIISHRAVFAAEWKIKTTSNGERSKLEWRRNSKSWINVLRSRQFRPKCHEKRGKK